MADYSGLVKELIIALRNNADHYMTVEGEAGLVHLLTDAADAIEELQARVKENDDWWAMAKTLVDMVAPKWIPVTERLPEKDGAYLVCYGNGLITTDTFMTFEDGRTKWYDSGYDIGGVTNWMPLPEPPKEESK